MHPKKRHSILHRCTALILAFAMIFTGTVVPGISGWTDSSVYAESAWEGDYLDVKDGTLTKGELYDSLAAKYGSGSYKYAESKPRYGWGTGGTEVKSGETEIITLNHNQSYTVGKKGRYLWSTSTDYKFTARTYYVLTGADADVTITNGTKVYKDTAAEITVTPKSGFHAQVWFAGKLQTTIEEGNTTGSFVPGSSGEVSVVYVEAVKPKHNVTLQLIGEEFGTASLDFSGPQQEGTPITLTAVPKDQGYIADISLEGTEFASLSGFNANRGKVGTFDVPASDVTVTVTFGEQTEGFDPAASYDAEGNMEVFVNTDGAFDHKHIETSLYQLLMVDPAAAKPAADLVKVEFLSEKQGADPVWRELDFQAPTGDWAWLNPANGYAEFPQRAGETALIRISWTAGEQYPAGSIEQNIILADRRIPTTIEGQNGTITYGASKAELITALQLQVTGADGANPADPEELVLSYDGELDVDGSPHTVKVSFPGNADYRPADASFQVTVKKAPCTIHYESQVVTYGDDYTFAIEKNPKDVETIDFIIGLDATVGPGEDMAATQIAIGLPDSMKGLENLLKLVLGDESTISVRKLMAAFNKLIDDYGSQLEELGISTESIETMMNTLESVTDDMGIFDEIKVTIHSKGDFQPKNAGVYLAGAVTADSNYETAFTAGYLVIVPQAEKAELNFRFQEINGIITQNLLLDGIYDLGADAYVSDIGHQEATDDVAHIFLKLGAEGNLDLVYADSNADLANHVGSGELTQAGTYEQIAFMPVENQMYYALPIARTYVVMEDAVNVQFIDHQGKVDIEQEFQYDGQPKGMEVLAVKKDGTVLPNDEHLTVRYIGLDAKGIEIYNSTERPVNVGFYKVIATYIDRETDLIGMAAGTMNITPGTAALRIISGSFEYDENYTVQVETTPEGMEKIVAIVGMSADGDIIEGEVGMINVDFPKRIDTLFKAALPLVYYNGVNLQDLLDLADKIKEILEPAGIDGSVIDQLTGTVTGLLTELGIDTTKANITFKDTEDVKPLPIGTYTAVALSCDINHEIGVMNMGMITIREKSIEQRKIIITAEDVTKTYGDKDPVFQWNYEVTGKTENAFYENHDFESVIVNGSEGVKIVNMEGSDLDAGVYPTALYPQAYVKPEYQKYYTVVVKRGAMTVLPKDFSQEAQLEGVEDMTYTGGEVLQEDLKVKMDRRTLIAGIDYEMTYENNVDAGTAVLTVKGKGNYTGSVSKEFVIKPAPITVDDVSVIDDQIYTGEEKTPELSVMVNGRTLKEGEDYTLSFEDNLNAGQAKAVITGKGNYTGAVEKAFVIKPADLDVEIEEIDFVYNGTAREPKVTVAGAVRDVDYTVTYENNINAGKAKVIVEGKGNYEGKVSQTFEIAKAPLTIRAALLEKTYGEDNPPFEAEYEGLQGSDTPEVVKGLTFDCLAEKYSIVGNYIIVPGNAKAENYKISYEDGRMTITARSLAQAEAGCAPKTYTGSAHRPAAKDLTVVVDGMTLKANVDFQITGYENNTDAGTAIVKIKGIGNYKDTARGSFEIQPAQLPDGTLEYRTTTYDGTAKEPKVAIKGMKEGVHFTVAYQDNVNAGTAAAVVTGIGNYAGSQELFFIIDKAKDTVALSISGWTYGDPANLPQGQTASGRPLTYQYIRSGKVLPDVPVDAGTYYVKASVEDSENYVGTHTQKAFTIAKRNLSDTKITVGDIPLQPYTGQEVTPAVSVYDGYTGAVLDADDYTVVYYNNTEIGQGSVTVSGKGNYTGSVTKTFEIREFGFFAGLNTAGTVYNGQVQKPSVIIEGYTEGTDYIVSYEGDFASAGTHKVVVSGIGKYAAYPLESMSFHIEKAKVEVSVSDLTVNYGEDYEPVAEIRGLIGEDVLSGTGVFHYYADEACTTEIDKPTTGGTYYVKVSGFESENYAITSIPGKLVIEKPVEGEDEQENPGKEPGKKPGAGSDGSGQGTDAGSGAGFGAGSDGSESERVEFENGSVPATGDSNPLGMWIGLLIAALLGAVVWRRKK